MSEVEAAQVALIRLRTTVVAKKRCITVAVVMMLTSRDESKIIYTARCYLS